jgi:hypothetical protein
MNDSGDSILDEGDILEADIRRNMKNDRPLTKVTMQVQDVGGGPQGQDNLTRPQNVLFHKDRGWADGRVQGEVV